MVGHSMVRYVLQARLWQSSQVRLWQSKGRVSQLGNTQYAKVCYCRPGYGTVGRPEYCKLGRPGYGKGLVTHSTKGYARYVIEGKAMSK